MEVKLNDLYMVYNEEIRKNVKNKRKIFMFERNKLEYLCDMKRVLEENLYDGGRYNIFVIFEPKIRVVMSQNIYDKIINHYLTRFVLMPKFSKYLCDRNCATRKDMGTCYAIKLLKKDLEKYKKQQKKIYFLKLDIAKYFYTIDHHKLLTLLKKEFTEEEYNLMKVILDSTKFKYINQRITYFSQKLGRDLPLYEHGKGLPIGNMTSQFLAIFYLSSLHHFMRHDLHLDFVNYMDDYIILSDSKEYLKECYEIIKEKIEKDYLLKVNTTKTYIASIKRGIPFLGHVFYIKKGKTCLRLAKSTKKNIKRGIKRGRYYFEHGKISLNQLFCSIENYKYSYKFINDKTVENLIARYWY